MPNFDYKNLARSKSWVNQIFRDPKSFTIEILHDPNLAWSKSAWSKFAWSKSDLSNVAWSKSYTVKIWQDQNVTRSKLCSIQIQIMHNPNLHDPKFARSKSCTIQNIHNSNYEWSKSSSIFFLHDQIFEWLNFWMI